MKKYLFIIMMLFTAPFYANALSCNDIYSQQVISGTYVDSGFKEMFLCENSKNLVIEILYDNITNYIFDNVDIDTAKNISRNLSYSIIQCDSQFEKDSDNSSIPFTDAVAKHTQCRHNIYSKNIITILKTTAEINNGQYKHLLKNMFKRQTDYILSLKDIDFDKFITLLAKNNLLSFNGKLFIGSAYSNNVENIVCENNHLNIDIIDLNTNEPVKTVIINQRNFAVNGCINANEKSFFKYISLWEKHRDRYILYERVPVYKFNIKNSYDTANMSNIYIKRVGGNFVLYDKVSDKIKLSYTYKLTGRGAELTEFAILNNEKKYVIYNAGRKKGISSSDLSLSLFKNMVNNFCSNKNSGCNEINLIEILPAID